MLLKSYSYRASGSNRRLTPQQIENMETKLHVQQHALMCSAQFVINIMNIATSDFRSCTFASLLCTLHR